MAKSAAAKGSYYKTRSKKFLEGQGFVVAFMERMMWIPDKRQPGKLIPIKVDQWGADLAAMNARELIFAQVKMATPRSGGGTQRMAALREFAKYPFPPFAQRWVMLWTPRAREPEILDCTELLNGTVGTLPPTAASAAHMGAGRGRRRT